MTVTLTDNNFDELVLRSPVPVLVDFCAEWCNTCRMVDTVVETLSDEYLGKAVVGKMNVDSYGELARHYDIHHIPAILIFRNGEIVDRYAGPAPQHILSARLAQQLILK